jgi:hypothetical protein
MAICESCGLDHHPAPAEPVVIDNGPNENSVAIAKIEAAAGIKREALYTEQERLRIEAEVAALRAENEALRNPVASTITVETPDVTEPEPEVVLPPTEAEPPETDGVSPTPPKEKKRKGWWDNYSS